MMVGRAMPRWSTIGPWLILAGCLIQTPVLAQTAGAERNFDFEIDTAPEDGVPDGWKVTCTAGAEFEYWRGQAASGRWCARTIHKQPDQSSILAVPVAGLIEPGRWYRIRYWFLAVGDSSRFGFRLTSEDFKQSHDIDAILELPMTDGKWHLYTTYPFRVTAEELATYPWLGFLHLENHVGSIAVDDIAIQSSGPPD